MTHSLLAGTLLLLGNACQRDNSATNERLDKMMARLDEIEKKIDKGGGGRGNAPQGPQPGRPDPAAVYSVPVEGSPAKGPATAKVTIVEAFEFACPFCYRVRGTMDELQKQYGDDLRIVHKQYVVHPQVATTPALAVCAAQKQGKYAEFEHAIWDKSWADGRMGDVSEAAMLKHAEELKLDMAKFKSDLAGAECKAQIDSDQKALAAVGVRGTPAFFINGRFLSGAQPADRFKALIDEEMKKANEAIKGGKKAEEYYSTIVKSGKKAL